MKIPSLAAVLLCLIGPQAYARQDVVPGSRYTSARGAALGDAFLPLADDAASSLFYNPAGIARLKKFEAVPFDLTSYVNSGYVNSFDIYSAHKVLSLGDSVPKLKESGSYNGAGFQLTPAFGTRYFAAGVMLNEQVGAQYDPAADTIHYRSTYQLVPAIGTGIALARGIVRLGYSLQWVHKAEGNVTVASAQADGYDQNIAQGSGFSHTVGAAISFPLSYLPAFNFVARNIGNTTYGGGSIYPFAKGTSGSPPDERMSVDGSFSLSPRLLGSVYANLVAELRDMTNTSKTSLAGRLALGTELVFGERFFVRAGIGSRYPSAGIGFKQKAGSFSLTWYSEEIGNGYLVQRDPRFLFNYRISAF